jgi:hypothetical protein
MCSLISWLIPSNISHYFSFLLVYVYLYLTDNIYYCISLAKRYNGRGYKILHAHISSWACSTETHLFDILS